MTPATVATVESPLQAVSLLEAVTSGAISVPEVVIVRGARSAIERVLALGDPAVRDAIVTRPARSTVMTVARAREVVIGDVFSTLAQIALSVRRRGRIVLLEDGAAAIRAWRILADRSGSLARAHDQRRGARFAGSIATRRLSAHTELKIVAGLPMRADTAVTLAAAGVDVVRHDFAWSRSVVLSLDPVTAAVSRTAHAVLGSALAADGHVERAFYEKWLQSCFESGAAVFLPHRRDEPWALQLARERDAVVAEASLPAELAVRDVAAELVVDTLPMTAALTLPIVRRGRPTVVRTTPVPPDAWTPATPQAMVELVAEVAALTVSHGA